MEFSNLKYYELFEAGKFLHVYNRANSEKNLLFYREINYKYFLQKYNEYLSDYLETFAYCLIPNHFHLIVRVKETEPLKVAILNDAIVEQFRRFFISFSQAVNKQEGRRGSLFQKRFKRLIIKDSTHFTQLIFYIHFNPVHHQICSDLKSYKWSSYKSMLSNKETKVFRKEVIEWFGGRKKFEQFHETYQMEKVNKKLIIES